MRVIASLINLSSWVRGKKKSGGRNRDTILGDAFEAFLGALLLDKDVAKVKEFIYLSHPQVFLGYFFIQIF